MEKIGEYESSYRLYDFARRKAKTAMIALATSAASIFTPILAYACPIAYEDRDEVTVYWMQRKAQDALKGKYSAEIINRINNAIADKDETKLRTKGPDVFLTIGGVERVILSDKVISKDIETIGKCDDLESKADEEEEPQVPAQAPTPMPSNPCSPGGCAQKHQRRYFVPQGCGCSGNSYCNQHQLMHNQGVHSHKKSDDTTAAYIDERVTYQESGRSNAGVIIGAAALAAFLFSRRGHSSGGSSPGTGGGSGGGGGGGGGGSTTNPCPPGTSPALRGPTASDPRAINNTGLYNRAIMYQRAPIGGFNNVSSPNNVRNGSIFRGRR